MLTRLNAKHCSWTLVFLLALTAESGCVGPQPTDSSVRDGERTSFVRTNYDKQEHLVPMRDGVELFTAVYMPKDASKEYPILLLRTPYSVRPYGDDAYRRSLGPSSVLSRDGYIFVYQDVRGKNMSEGEFVNMRPHVDHKSDPQDIDESTDTYDTIDWLLANITNHNGRGLCCIYFGAT